MRGGIYRGAPHVPGCVGVRFRYIRLGVGVLAVGVAWRWWYGGRESQGAEAVRRAVILCQWWRGQG